MKIEDPHQLVDKKRLAAMCQLAGLPRPEAVKPFGQPGRHLYYGVRFKASSGVPAQMLRIDMMNTAHGAPAAHWVAANRALAAIGLPARSSLVALPEHVFGRPAVVFPYVELSTGQQLVALSKEFWPTAAGDLGKVCTELAATALERFGVRATDGAFRPLRGTWADEWVAHSASLLAGARAYGVDLGSLSVALHEGVLARREALAEADRFCLVHGELRPSALLYDLSQGLPQLAALDGWDTAMIGDPLVEVGYFLSYPPQTLAPVLAGVGRERVRSWLEPAALARIEAYHLSLCATRPRYVAEQLRAVGGARVVDVLEAARKVAEAALEPGFARARLEAALEITAPWDPPTSDPGPDEAHTAIRSAVSFARGDEGVQAAHAPILVASLGAALLSEQVAADPLRATAAREASAALLGVVENRGLSERVEPIADAATWRRDLATQMAAEAQRSVCSTVGLLLVWLLCEAMDSLGQTLSDSVLRGVELTARSLALHEQQLEPAAPLMLQHTVYGLAALRRLEAMGVGEFPELAEILRDRLLDQVDPIEVAGIPGGSGDAALLPLLADPSATPEQRLTRPLLILALRAVRGEPLPATEVVLLKCMGG